MSKFKEGQSGNPAGRPRKGASLRDTLQQFFLDPDPMNGKRRIDILLNKAYEKATSSKGNMVDVLELMRYAIAPLKATSEAEENGDENEDSKVLKVEVTYTKTPEASTEINPADDPV